MRDARRVYLILFVDRVRVRNEAMSTQLMTMAADADDNKVSILK